MAQSGTLYSVSDAGAQETVGSWPVAPTSSWEAWPKPINALGMGQGGSSVFASQRLSTTSIKIMSHDAASNTWNTTPSLILPQGNTVPGSLVAGAVDLSTGHYLFGGYVQTSTTNGAFYLWSYDPANPNVNERLRLAGHFDVPGAGNATNGDMAFDANGNLYLVASKNPTTVIYTVTATNLHEALKNGAPLSATRTVPRSIAVQDVNGIAFNPDGTIMLGNQTTMQRYDPSTWRLLGTVSTRLPGSTDLASCASPSTLTLKKDVVSRYNPQDQFTLRIDASEATNPADPEVAESTTAGSATGIQAQQVGPVPVVAGKDYTVSETLAGTVSGAEAGNTGASGGLAEHYTSTWQCAQAGAVIASGTGTSGRVHVPARTSAAATQPVECTFTNTAHADTTLSLVKDFDIHYGAPADPKAWTLTAQARATNGGSSSSTPPALTFTSGQKRTVNPGDYRLDELAQPGYELKALRCSVDGGGPRDIPLGTGDAAQVFTVPAHHATVCTLTNQDQPGSVSWHKEGARTGTVLTGGVWRLDGPNGFSKLVDNQYLRGNAGGGSESDGDSTSDPTSYVVSDLPWGHYTVTEVQAPQGYQRTDGTAAEFDVVQNHLDAQHITLRDSQLIIHVRKYGYPERGQASPSLIGGSQFRVLKDSGGKPGEPTGQVQSNSAGQFDVAGLSPGTYWLQETQAPAGHSLLADAVPFEVHEDTPGTVFVTLLRDEGGKVTVSGDRLSLQVFDDRAVSLPAAGGPGSTVFTRLGVGLLACAVVAGAAVVITRRLRGTHA